MPPGKYAVWSGQAEGEGWADWDDNYVSKGYEYFDVWAPEMATHYGQVFWTDQGDNPIPDAIVKRFAGKTMAIVGYEQDQVSAVTSVLPAARAHHRRTHRTHGRTDAPRTHTRRHAYTCPPAPSSL